MIPVNKLLVNICLQLKGNHNSFSILYDNVRDRLTHSWQDQDQIWELWSDGPLVKQSRLGFLFYKGEKAVLFLKNDQEKWNKRKSFEHFHFLWLQDDWNPHRSNDLPSMTVLPSTILYSILSGDWIKHEFLLITTPSLVLWALNHHLLSE